MINDKVTNFKIFKDIDFFTVFFYRELLKNIIFDNCGFNCCIIVLDFTLLLFMFFLVIEILLDIV